ncbi:MAG: Imm26 family immunity protein [Spirochaetota bacterium]
MKKRIILRPGAVLEIPLEKKYISYCRVLESNSFAFYDLRVKKPIQDIEQILSAPVLFITLIYMDSAKERWTKVGFHSLKKSPQEIPPLFTQNVLNLKEFKIHYHDGTIKKATKEEVIGLERFAAWEAWAIEERLNDHFAGRKNKYVEEMRNPDLYRKDVKMYPERVKKLIEGL